MRRLPFTSSGIALHVDPRLTKLVRLLILSVVAATVTATAAPATTCNDSTQVKQVLVLGGKFSNTSDPYSPAQLAARIFGPETGYRSITDYFCEVSRGKVTFEGDVPAGPNGGLFDSGQPSQTNLGAYTVGVLDTADQYIDYADYDTNGDGFVDLVTVPYPDQFVRWGGGLNTAYTGFAPWLPYRTNDTLANGDTVVVDRVVTGPLLSDFDDPNDGDQLPDLIDIGLYCHEWGHSLGMVDLYSFFTTNISGFWSVMGQGWKGAYGNSASGVPQYGYRQYPDDDVTFHNDSPTHVDAWHKKQQGWLDVTTITCPQRNVQLQPILTSGKAIVVDPGLGGSEYFLLEYRRAVPLTFDKDLPASGLAIWHVGTNIQIEEADSLTEVVRGVEGGDSGDLFPGSTGQQLFDDSHPNVYKGPSIKSANSRTYGGIPTGLSISNIALAADSSYISFDVIPSQFHGVIAQNTTWSGCVTLDGDVRVQAGVTLTIAAGTHVHVQPTDAANRGTDSQRIELIVRGGLVVNGTSGSPVTFSSWAATPAEADWFGIRADSVSAQASVSYANVQHAIYGIVVNTTQTSSVANSTFLNNSTADLYGGTGGTSLPLTVSANTITVGSGTGMEFVGIVNNLDVVGNAITGNSSSTAGITIAYAGSAAPTIRSNTIQSLSNGKGVNLSSGAAVLTTNAIQDCKWGVYVTGGTASIGTSQTDSDNFITGHTTAGIHVQGSGVAPVVRNNEISTCYNGVVVQNGANPDLGTSSVNGNNNIFDNSNLCLWNRNTSGTVQAQGNWWGACDPPSCTSGSVNVANWLCNQAGRLLASSPSPSSPALPTRTGLLGSMPNPFSVSSEIRFGLASASRVELSVFDVSGRRVRHADLGVQPAGWGGWTWDSRDDGGAALGNGVYYVRFSAGGIRDQRRVTLLR